MLNEILIPASRTTLVESDDIPTRVWFVFFQNVYRYIQKGFGAFYSNTTQTVAANTDALVTLSTAGSIRSVALDVATSKITVSRNGVYNVQGSLQLANTNGTNADDVTVWIKVNGVNLPNSTRVVTVPVLHATTFDGSVAFTFNMYIDLVPTDYIQLYWRSRTGTTQIKIVAAGTYPAAPSVVVTVDQIV